jgi:hypothetical protein
MGNPTQMVRHTLHSTHAPLPFRQQTTHCTLEGLAKEEGVIKDWETV